MIEVEVLGAGRTVTGSKHLVHTPRATVLLDCGLYQGRRAEAFERNRHLPVDTARLDAVVLSHAHIDHSGALPLLYRQGYRGPVYATPATRDLAAPMLLDAAMIQEADARYIDRLVARGEPGVEPVTPLYDQDDVATVLTHLVAFPYRQRHQVAPGVTVTFLDAGHVLGSAITVLDIDDEGRSVRLVYTGDLGRHHLPILRDPEVPSGAECLISESTYGDRLHAPMARTEEELASVVRRTLDRGGKVLIPTFALERAQEVIYDLKRLRQSGQLPQVPVYLDSPLAVRLTDVFRLHPECYDHDARALLQGQDSPFDFAGLRYVSSVEDSMAIVAETRPSIVIAASGMCEAGRILHHLRAGIDDARNTIAIVGFQAQHTLGRRLVERRREVRIFGVMRERRAEVAVLDGFSAHADQQGLLDFAEAVRDRGPLRQVALVHGEPPAQQALLRELLARGFARVTAPAVGDRLRV
jgi:metallo-beta-lactamase family protein